MRRWIESMGLRAVFRQGGFPRFLLVGVMNTLFGYVAFCLIFLVTGKAILSAALSTILGVLFNFCSIGGLVFGSSDRRLIGRFTSVYALLFILNAIALNVATSRGLSVLVVQAALLAPLAGLSFVLNRHFVFGAVATPRATLDA
jgi:putative flippase GtrA